MPVREIAALARDRGVWFHVDGAQSAGMIPVDVHAVGCDSFGTSGHKWMGGAHGTGALYVRADRLDEVHPTEVGAYSDGGDVRLPDRFTLNPTAQRYEPGTRDVPSIVGLAAAAAFQTDIGTARIEERTTHLARYLQGLLRAIPGVDVLTPADPALSAAMTTFRTDRVPYERLLAVFGEAHLRARGVAEEGIDAVRVSTHIFNSEAECDRVAAATREALARAGAR
jgi:selenocysteine lyase/cysteine desulfurase